MTIDENELKRRQLTEPEQIVGKTIARVWKNLNTTIAITFDDGTYLCLDAESGHYDEGPDIKWNPDLGPWQLHCMGFITEEQYRELERRDDERREAHQRNEARRLYEFYKAKVEEQPQAQP